MKANSKVDHHPRTVYHSITLFSKTRTFSETIFRLIWTTAKYTTRREFDVIVKHRGPVLYVVVKELGSVFYHIGKCECVARAFYVIKQ